MHEPSLRTSRLVIAGGLVAAIAIGGAGFLLGRLATLPPEAPPGAVAPEPSRAAVLTETIQPTILGRADIIDLADRASDAAASQGPLPPEIADLAGRRFDLVIPFGCDGPAAPDSNVPLSWRYDAQKQALRIQVASTVWQTGDWGFTEPTAAAQTAEGFWVSRPWSSADRCPQPAREESATGAQPVILPAQTLAIAEFASTDLAREKKRAPRSFDTVQRVAPDAFNASSGFRVRLTGRFTNMPGGGPVRCIQPAGVEQRPICVVSVSFEELQIEGGGKDGVLATWSLGHPPQAN